MLRFNFFVMPHSLICRVLIVLFCAATLAAHLIGHTVALPNDGDVGATFQSTPPSTFKEETGCFVNYVSFRESDPPVPGLVLGECIEQDGKGYFAISVDADPGDPRVDNVGTDFLPGWGLHLSDMPLAHGDLVRLAKRQAAAWLEDQ